MTQISDTELCSLVGLDSGEGKEVAFFAGLRPLLFGTVGHTHSIKVDTQVLHRGCTPSQRTLRDLS